MNLKAFHKTNLKSKMIPIMIFFLILFLTIVIVYQSYAFYVEQKSYDVIKGQVTNYAIKDLKINVLIDGKVSKTFPSKEDGYQFTGLTCNQNVEANWNNQKWNLSITQIPGRTKCNLSFSSKTEAKNLKEVILEKEGNIEAITKKSSPDFSKIATIDEGMFATPDDYGTSYYYRGNINDNYVLFGDYLWRIVRINGDGSIRLIYAKTLHDSDTIFPFRTIYNPTSKNPYQFNAFVGYMYGNIQGTTYKETHQNTYNSLLKDAIDEWYRINLRDLENYLADNSFCNDRSLAKGYEQAGYGTTKTIYALDRINSYSPTLQCAQQNDRFTVSDTTVGNGALDYPIGTISADELMFAGAVVDEPNPDYYLYIGDNWRTMTPSATENYPTVCTAESGGPKWSLYCHVSVGDGGIQGIRPVINLKKTVTTTYGDGTKENPYIIS